MNKQSLEKSFKAYIEENQLLHRGDSIVVGLSGGADSVCLLHLLCGLRDDLALTLTAVHVHHGMRGEEADRDARFSEEMAESLGVPFVHVHLDVPTYATEKHLTPEEAARILRYEALENALKDKKADVIALAHHRDDQAETVLMNLFRGTGPAGLVGMRPKNGNRIRPLIFASKKEILEYLSEKNVKYVEDSTNFSDEHTRNRIRSELLPLAEELYPEATAHIANITTDVAEWQRAVEEQADGRINNIITERNKSKKEQENEGYKRENGEIEHKKGENEYKSGENEQNTYKKKGQRIVTNEYRKENKAIRHELLKRAFSEIVPAAKDIGRVHYEALDDLILNKEAGKRISLPYRITAIKSYEEVTLRQEKVEPTYDPGSKSLSSTVDVTLKIPGTTEVSQDEKVFRLEANLKSSDEIDIKNSEKGCTKYINYDKIEKAVVFRTPREGDSIVINSDGGRKKLSRYYIDRKVPRDERADQLVVAEGDEVIWALPDRLSEVYKVDETTKRVLELKVMTF